ncbi:S-adenosyl-L-methionine-dependent methyltransferase [Thermoascus aurantiacus ATCC 26904]
MAESTATSAQREAQPQAQVLEIDAAATDNDSAYGQELSTYTASLTSSVLEYRKENGRTYHGYRDGSYLMPNDETELDRLDMMHEMYLTVMDRKLFFAPIGPSPQRVYDIATGTGIWAIQFGEEFPSAEVIGSDLSPCQPNICTKPGGWVEFQDWDSACYSEDGTTKDTAIEDYYRLIVEGYESQGYETCPGPKLEQWLYDAGFQDVKAEKLRIPMGTWPKDKKFKTLGAWNLMQAETGFEASVMALLTRFHGWSADEVKVLAAQTLKDARDRNIHPVFHFWVVYGRKPESASA